MKIIKQIITVIAFASVFLLLGVTGAYLLVDNTTLLAQVTQQIESVLIKFQPKPF